MKSSSGCSTRDTQDFWEVIPLSNTLGSPLTWWSADSKVALDAEGTHRVIQVVGISGCPDGREPFRQVFPASPLHCLSLTFKIFRCFWSSSKDLLMWLTFTSFSIFPVYSPTYKRHQNNPAPAAFWRVCIALFVHILADSIKISICSRNQAGGWHAVTS